MLQPVLEIYLLWHPSDAEGAEVAELLGRHFHGGLFGNLLAGAVEVYQRCTPWSGVHDAPRPVPLPADPPQAGVVPAQHVAVVPLVGLGMARAVQRADSPWRAYLERLAAAQAADPAHVQLWPMRLGGTAPAGRLAELFGATQYLAEPDPHATHVEPVPQLRARDLVQALAQWLSPVPGTPLRVFISHTKRQGTPDEPVADLVEAVRRAFGAGRVGHFYDAQDLQPGADWDQALRSGAASCALLALRTDLYASREWCQREMLTAKVHGMPVVVLDALTQGDARGSFLMDHTPRFPLRRGADGQWDLAAISRAINLLADAWLHRALWLRLQDQAATQPRLGHFWWLPHAPEPSTLARWLPGRPPGTAGETLAILHPDPPLAEDERRVLQSLAALAGYGDLDVTTPRLLAARGA
jgi:hypothetical protein